MQNFYTPCLVDQNSEGKLLLLLLVPTIPWMVNSFLTDFQHKLHIIISSSRIKWLLKCLIGKTLKCLLAKLNINSPDTGPVVQPTMSKLQSTVNEI